LAELRRLLGTTRLLSLTGAGGLDKTRLALQVASTTVADFHDGTWLVELAPVTDPTLLARTIANVFTLRERAGQSLQEVIVKSLGHRRVLLVLDNCEHLLGECAELVIAILRACPWLRILATSREQFGIAAKWPGRYRLWVCRARANSSRRQKPCACSLTALGSSCRAFHLPGQSASIVADLCRRLDGMPLAIELAAAPLKGLSVGQIAARLDDPFGLLTGFA
jgi:predicted ATPase